MTYPKRLIEVDLPIARISAHARREKSIRHGHISTLHIWWARRPLAACRAVICAALWPDPADPLCPPAFREAATTQLVAFAKRVNSLRISEEGRRLQATLSPESRARWEVFSQAPALDPADPAIQNVLRFALLDFIADFANWDNSTVSAYLETSRALTQAAHEALGGEPGTRPLVVDPFAGGGSIPLEALRVGADAFASDLNPVAVLLNKVVLEYIPKYGQKLADEVRKWGQWIKEQAEKELAEFYPKDPDGATPIAYLWARTIRCEGTGCGAEVPLMRSLWLAKKANKSVALKIVPNPKEKRVDFEIIGQSASGGCKPSEVRGGTVKRGSATCPCCGYTTSLASVKLQLITRHGGAQDSRLICKFVSPARTFGRQYRLTTVEDQFAIEKAIKKFSLKKTSVINGLSFVPNEDTTHYHSFVNRGPLYGMNRWEDYYTPRQNLVLGTLVEIIRRARPFIFKSLNDDDFSSAVLTNLAFALDKQADSNSSLCAWRSTSEDIGHTFGRQAIPMLWDFVEGNIFSGATRDWSNAVEGTIKAISCFDDKMRCGHAERSSAASHVLPNDSADAMITDPPYFFSVQYADLSDYFYVWLRRSIGSEYPALFQADLTPKDDEIIVQSPSHQNAPTGKNTVFYQQRMKLAMKEGNRYVRSNGIALVVFAHTSTSGWESQLNAMIEGGWIITGSWPIDTEMATRVIAQGRSVLASSVHLVCRPRVSTESGDWRDILAELPQRMHEWMPRLASEGVVGADAIFACLGPALEIFSRHARVEKANGDVVPLKEYLEHVWAAVSKEALSTIFRDADASGLEPDARITAMWLWTIGGGAPIANGKLTDDIADEEVSADEVEGSGKTASAIGFTLEFDAALKIAQGLGIHLEKSESIVEVKGEKARLLAVAERTKYLFGKDAEAGAAGVRKPKKKLKQASLFDELGAAEEVEGGGKELQGPPAGATVLDRLHQAMILFGAQRGELLKRFLVEEGIGKDARLWKLAQALAALYPPGTDERRWVEGVLARKKGLGL